MREKLKRLVKRHPRLIKTLVVLWALFAVTRFSHFTYYIPFTGRIFHVSPSNTTTITIRSEGDCVIFTRDMEGFQEVCDVLNDVRYRYCLPYLYVEGDNYIILETGDTEASAIFGARNMYSVSPGSVCINGMHYYLRGEPLAQLIELAKESS